MSHDYGTTLAPTTTPIPPKFAPVLTVHAAGLPPEIAADLAEMVSGWLLDAVGEQTPALVTLPPDAWEAWEHSYGGGDDWEREYAGPVRADTGSSDE